MSESGAAERKLTIDDLNRFLGLPVEAGAEPPPPAAGQVETPDPARYLEAAAVLAAYDPFSLRPAGGRSNGEGREGLLDHLLPAGEQIEAGPRQGLWTLSFAPRRAALRRLATRENMRQALEANPDRVDSAVQRMFERLLDGQLIELGRLSREELAALITVVDWTEGILDDLPAREQINSALRRADLLAPMQRLAGQVFVNREKELQRLAEYVFGPSTSHVPLFVFGPGGVGKSTLLAHFILVHLDAREMPFAYIDIDRPTIRPEHPLTILLEIAAQLQRQLDIPAGYTESILKEISYGIGREDAAQSLESLNSGYDSSYYSGFLRNLLSYSNRADDGVVVIVDTFEEAQFLGPDVVWPLLEFLFDVAQSLPTFRLILSGRDLPPEFISRAYPALIVPTGEWEPVLEQIPLPDRPINVGLLDEGAARDLLQRLVLDAGLSPLTDEELDDVIGIVGQNPMTLKLAARLLRDEGVEDFRAARNEWLVRLKAEKIQALLYGRILYHIHDKDVRKVAYPGLIVRRIAPDVIREVLAKPCGLALENDYEAQRIFWELAREAALVRPNADGSLGHRPDVRRMMLEDLTDHVRLEIIEQIDRAAVAFYAGQQGGVARAEEIYHRLRLGQTADTLDGRWAPEAADYLKGAVEELQAGQRLWLAEKLHVTLDESVREAASQEAWEDQAARAAGRWLQRGAAEEALTVLSERMERLPRSRLYALEAEAFRLLGRFDEALRVARVGVEALSKAGAIDMALDLQLRMAAIEEGRGNLQEAEQLADGAAAIAAHSYSNILKLQAQITRLRLQRQLRPDAEDERAALRRDAPAIVSEETLHTLRSRPVLLREAAAELGLDDPGIARTAIVTLGLEVKTDAQAQALGRAIATLNEARATEKGADNGLTKAVEQFEGANYAADEIRKWVTTVSTTTDAGRIGQALGMAAPGSKTLRDFQTYFRAGVDNALRGAD